MVELNQSCSCKSGLKYRDCCLPLEWLPEFLVTNGVCKTFKISAEQYSLNILRKKSKEFQAFYNSERSKIRNQIVWGIDPNLTANMRTLSVSDNASDINLILFKKTPIGMEDAFDAAHELRHLLLGEAGFPKAFITDYGLRNGFDTRFATILLNTVMDPLVNFGLIQFGFDLWEYFDKASKAQRSMREFGPREPLQERVKYFEVSFYIQKSLDFELANAQSKRDSDFMEWYATIYPNTVREATGIINEIKYIGLDTPAKVGLILTNIIKRFNLNDTIKLS